MEKGKYQALLGSDLVLENPDLYSQDSSDELSKLDMPSPSELTQSSSGEEQVDERIKVKTHTRVSKGKDMNVIWAQATALRDRGFKMCKYLYSSLKDLIYFSEYCSMARMKQKARYQPEHPLRAKHPHLDNRRERT